MSDADIKAMRQWAKNEVKDWTQAVIEEKGCECGNCGAWRILRDLVDGIDPSINGLLLRLIEECAECGDEAFDLYEVENDNP